MTLLGESESESLSFSLSTESDTILLISFY
jgi:hypothetical protein